MILPFKFELANHLFIQNFIIVNKKHSNSKIINYLLRFVESNHKFVNMTLKLPHLLIAIQLISIATCQTSSGKIAGLGIGTFIIIIAIAFSVVWCLACRSSSYPEVYSIIGIAIPAILIIIFIFVPKESQRPVTISITDSNFTPHIVFMVISIVGLIVALVFLMINEIFVFKKAKNVARSAFIMKEEEQDKLIGNQNPVQGSRQELQEKSNNQISMGQRNSQNQIQERPLRIV